MMPCTSDSSALVPVFALSTTNSIGATGAMVPAYFSMTGMRKWYRSAVCGHPVTVLADTGPAVQLKGIPLPQSVELGLHPVAYAGKATTSIIYNSIRNNKKKQTK